MAARSFARGCRDDGGIWSHRYELGPGADIHNVGFEVSRYNMSQERAGFTHFGGQSIWSPSRYLGSASRLYCVALESLLGFTMRGSLSRVYQCVPT